jgi:murein DD-endopeptidase MepM/ murein hydrolase activator NlpD
MTGGPHNWAGLSDARHPWNSLDFVPSNGQVFAAKAGYAYTNTDNNDCPTPGFIRIVHGDGYQTSYYHLDPNSIRIANGDYVFRGQWIGNIGMSVPCGGSAPSAHVHFSLWFLSSGAFSLYSPPYNYNSMGVDWGGISPSARGAGSQTQIGAWMLDDGTPSAQYNG